MRDLNLELEGTVHWDLKWRCIPSEGSGDKESHLISSLKSEQGRDHCCIERVQLDISSNIPLMFIGPAIDSFW